MVWATSPPYAPTFWIGVAPTRPGMPDRASTPLHSCSTAVADQGVPVLAGRDGHDRAGAGRTSACDAAGGDLDHGAVEALGRRSAGSIRRPSTSTGSPAASRSRTASTSSVLGGGRDHGARRTADPQRGVLGEAGAVAASASDGRVSDSEVTSQDSPRRLEMPVTTDPSDRQAQSTTARAAPSTLSSPQTASIAIVTRSSSMAVDRAAEDDLGAVVVVGHHDRLGEPDEVGPHPGRIADPVGHHPQRACPWSACRGRSRRAGRPGRA